MANTRQYSLKSSKNLLADSTTIRDEFGHTDGVNVGSHDWGRVEVETQGNGNI